jgi:hypothetical protein
LVGTIGAVVENVTWFEQKLVVNIVNEIEVTRFDLTALDVPHLQDGVSAFRFGAFRDAVVSFQNSASSSFAGVGGW